MGTCCQSSTADIADDVPLFYPFAGLDALGKFGEVHVGCGVHAVVFDCYVVSTPVGLSILTGPLKRFFEGCSLLHQNRIIFRFVQKEWRRSLCRSW